MFRYLLLLLIVFLATSCSQKKALVKVPEPEKREIKVEEEDERRNAISEEAVRWLGVPYKYGGNDRKGVDCSGLVLCVYRDAAGIKLPRSSREQCEFCKRINREHAEAGDLVFFSSSVGGGKVSHVGILTGGDRFIHSSTSKGVIESSLSDDYYRRHFLCFGRVPGMKSNAASERPGDKDAEAIRDAVRDAMK